ncbi:hypothetical protein OG455_39680 [Kitasatospora sp. NBC_01287]|uniref:hypothetical protein n=1 Tax=Kitasatospora sp. NBC_01287 TaxID=2903573 RepID=UPI0022592E7B|nr:hypothetical protein [Kitasatospora sp. NBC_01287]MCX4751557.1 hypothetical protein [Kitasatospora sp. NBC_01287]
MGEITPAGRGSIADRLDRLISTSHPPGRGAYGYDEIAKLSREFAAVHGGPTISHQSVLNIRSGKVVNPSVNSLQALANVFQVDITYFLAPESAGISAGASAGTPAGISAGTPAALPAAPPPPAVSAGVLAARLNELFEAARPKGRPPLGNEEVAEAVTAAGARISAAEIAALRAGRPTAEADAALRTGEWDNPARRQLQCLADYFRVPGAYFFDDAVAARVADDLALLNALKQVGAREVALRAVAALDDEALSALVPMIEHLGRGSKRHRM